jgi:hypothetical protein
MRIALYPQRPSHAPCQTSPFIQAATHPKNTRVFNDLLRVFSLNYPPITPI